MLTLLATLPSGAPPFYMIIPFIVMLSGIAVMPLVHKHHWERYYSVWAVVLGSISVAYYLLSNQSLARLGHTAHEYVSFIALVGSLFIVSGGIHIRVKGSVQPWFNALYLLFGAVISNFIGTTGASMLLIRPWIRMNQPRVTSFHIVFFIFIVSNVGGCLTPIGDPPLFLGFLKGVPFWWTLQHCWEAWLIGIGALLAIFYAIDARHYSRVAGMKALNGTGGKASSQKAPAQATTSAAIPAPVTHANWGLSGKRNILFLLAILGSVFIKSPPFLREAIMATAALASYFSTSRHIHTANDFNFEPIKEVAWLFLGIFATMMPALDYLQANASMLGLSTEWHFYWATGLLSGVLDNAPTYLAFLATAFGMHHLDFETGMPQFIAEHGGLLLSISLSSVFFGAMTYIGNGPNFMVKAIAERANVETPGFFKYIACYALPILLPVLFFVGILFFSPWRLF